MQWWVHPHSSLQGVGTSLGLSAFEEEREEVSAYLARGTRDLDHASVRGHCRRLRSPTLPDRPPAPPAPPNLLDGTTWWSRTGASSRRARARGAGSRASHAAAAAAGAREPALLPPRWPHRGPRVTLPAPDAGLPPARAWYFSGQANLPEDRNLPSHALQVPGHRYPLPRRR